MRYALASAALLGLALANPVPQAVTSAISPASSAPAGCVSTESGTFEIQVVNVTSSRRKRDTVLTLTLTNGVLTDEAGRTGYIAANYQFQFDKPPQAGAIYTAGWSVCSNGTLALGNDAVFYQCLSGDFYNLYDQSTGAQCSPVYIEVINASGGSSGSSPTVVSQQTDGQPTETPVTQISDGQPQATTGVPVTQISDGQPQGPTGAPVTQISDGQPQGPTGAPVTQISDGQPQASTGAPVTQISDGQPQATTGAPVTQISDGQPQASTGAPVTQISDGQPQATTGAPVTQISDGQPQASTGAPVTQISDGQPQATTGAPVTQITDGQPQAATTAATPYNAAATAGFGGVVALGAFVAAVVAL